jgi:hypothetical protein
MSIATQRRGGTTVEHSTFIGLAREITIDTTKKTVVVHDGVTAGGFPLQLETNFKTINGQAITGTGNLTISGGGETISSFLLMGA